MIMEFIAARTSFAKLCLMVLHLYTLRLTLVKWLYLKLNFWLNMNRLKETPPTCWLKRKCGRADRRCVNGMNVFMFLYWSQATFLPFTFSRTLVLILGQPDLKRFLGSFWGLFWHFYLSHCIHTREKNQDHVS